MKRRWTISLLPLLLILPVYGDVIFIGTGTSTPATCTQTGIVFWLNWDNCTSGNCDTATAEGAGYTMSGTLEHSAGDTIGTDNGWNVDDTNTTPASSEYASNGVDDAGHNYLTFTDSSCDILPVNTDQDGMLILDVYVTDTPDTAGAIVYQNSTSDIIVTIDDDPVPDAGWRAVVAFRGCGNVINDCGPQNCDLNAWHTVVVTWDESAAGDTCKVDIYKGSSLQETASGSGMDPGTCSADIWVGEVCSSCTDHVWVDKIVVTDTDAYDATTLIGKSDYNECT